MQFIEPCLPLLRDYPPTGPLWSHELKFDGFRIQAHREGDQVMIYSRRGADFTKRAGRHVVEALRALPCKSCVLDGELIGLDDDGLPSFGALHRRKASGLAVLAFDLLACNGQDLRARQLGDRRQRLAGLFSSDGGAVGASEAFEDPNTLLQACEQLGFEGIVSKRVDRPYRSGPSRGDWIKVKTKSWKEANRYRFKLFERA